MVVYPVMGVSKNTGTPKSSILIGFSIINHPFWGTIIFGNTLIYKVLYIPGGAGFLNHQQYDRMFVVGSDWILLLTGYEFTASRV